MPVGLRFCPLGFVLVASVAMLGGRALAAGRSVDLRNFTYTSQPCGPKPQTVRGGRGEYHDNDPRVDPGTVYVLDVDAVYRGRIGTRDVAVVVLTCEFHTGSGSVADAYAIDGSRATLLRFLGDVDAGSGGYAPSDWIHVRFAGDRLFVDRLSNGDAVPSRWTVTTYRLSRNTLHAIYALDHHRGS